MKKILIEFSLLTLISIILISCKEGDSVDIEYTSAYPVAGEWLVSEYDLEGNLLYGPYILNIYNTAFSNDSVWVENIYDSGIKVKALKNGENTFSTTQSTDVEGVFTSVDIQNANIINNDSIYFEVTIYDGTEVVDNFVEAGHRSTGFDHP